jgi:hypothetical protein
VGHADGVASHIAQNFELAFAARGVESGTQRAPNRGAGLLLLTEYVHRLQTLLGMDQTPSDVSRKQSDSYLLLSHFVSTL